MKLETPDLTLIPCDPKQILQLIDGRTSFQDVVGLPAASGFREMYTGPDVSDMWLKSLRTARAANVWDHGFFLVHRELGEVIGSAGFKGPPDAEGSVEIAYGVAPEFEGYGYATQAAEALTKFAFAEPSVAVVRAHTLHSGLASQRVLTKCGFSYVGDFDDPEDGNVQRWERLKER